MSYSIYDSTGYKGDMASIRGLAELRDWAEKEDNKVMLEFLDKGHADPDELLENGIKGWAIKDNKNVAKTLEGLTKLLSISQDIVILNDGTME